MKYIKLFENFSGKTIGKEVRIEDTIKNLKKLPKELKEVAIGLVEYSTKAKNGKVTGLQLHPDLKRKIEEGGYPNGFSMGVDKNGYFIHTHRARSKSHEKPTGITIKEMKFIDSTG